MIFVSPVKYEKKDLTHLRIRLKKYITSFLIRQKNKTNFSTLKYAKNIIPMKDH